MLFFAILTFYPSGVTMILQMSTYGLRPMKTGIHGPVTGRVESLAEARTYLKHHDVVVLAKVPDTHPKFENGGINYDRTKRGSIKGQTHGD